MKKNIQACPICLEGKLVPRCSKENGFYKGEEYFIDYNFSVCSVCASDVTTPEQSKINQVKIRDAHRNIDGLLLGNKIREIRESLNISQAMAAKVFGGGPNSFSKYERGEVTQSVAMDKLIKLAAKYPEILGELKEMSGIHIPVCTRGSIAISICSYNNPCDLGFVREQIEIEGKRVQQKQIIGEGSRGVTIGEDKNKVAYG